MSPLPPPPTTPNSKRYWGEEKNIDSIYSIYLKKISYTYNNDITLSTACIGRRPSQPNGCESSLTTKSLASASSNDLVKLGSNLCNSHHKQYNTNDINCQKQDESPRGRRNFFQKYRRRSCSMDKYSFEKHHQKNSSTPNNKDKSTKTMKITPYSKKSSHLKQDLSISHDKLDSLLPSRSGSLHSNNSKKTINDEFQKTSHDSANQSTQSLQWETRQIRILQAATLDHVLKFILLINSSKDLSQFKSDDDSSVGDSALEEERNNVAHIIHVFFCTYRTYTNPYELMLKLMDYSDICRIDQYRFVMHYWMDNYPEDFDYIVDIPENGGISGVPNQKDNASAPSINSYTSSLASYDSSATTKTKATTESETSVGPSNGSQTDNLNRRLSNLSIKTSEEKQGVSLVNELLRVSRDEYIKARAMKIEESKVAYGTLESESSRKSRMSHHSASRNSAVLDLDSRYVAQQLTAIDLENFLDLRPYALLEGTKSDKRVQCMIRNFNLLSRHVVVTILKSHNPNVVTAHWIAIAMNLRKIKNFNSLKAIIAGLTNESIYRLKQVIWSKLDKTNMTNFRTMASIVDDVNNQMVLRQTQLMVEGTAKMSIEDDSFGTIPYLGTFLTDLNMIDARYPNYVPSPKDETSKLKLINFEKCAKQFEILTQVQLLQKNVLASLHAIQKRNHFDEQTTLNRLKVECNKNYQMLLAKPAIPKVARLFENWFYDENVANMTDKQCYEISVSLEQNTVQR